MADPKVLLGSFDLNDAAAKRKPPSGKTYGFVVLAKGFEPGTPAAVTKVFGSFLLDGNWEQVDKYGNRQRQMQVLVVADDGNALDEAERVLQLAADAAVTLTFRLPNRSQDTVFDVLHVEPAEQFDDLADVLRNERVYSLTITCQPWARLPTLSTVTMVPGAGTVTSLDVGGTPANWTPVSGSGSPTGTTSTVSGDARMTFSLAAPSGDMVTLGYDWVGTVGGSATYLVIDVQLPARATGATVTMGSSFDTGVRPVAAVPGSVGGFTKYYFLNAGGTPRFWFRGKSIPPSSGSAFATFLVTALGKATALPAGALAVLPIKGSKRTTGSVRIYPASGSLPTAGVAVYADQTMLTYGWQPDLSATYPYAPAGTYMAFIPSASTIVGVAAGDEFELTFTPTGGTAQTRKTVYATAAVNGAVGLPIGPFDLAGTRDGLVGPGVWAAKRNGGALSLSGENMRLVRMTSLRALKADENARGLVTLTLPAVTTEVFLDARSAEQPRGGVAITVSGVTQDASRYVTYWQPMILVPPLTALWVSPNTASVDAEFYAHYFNHTSGLG